MIIFWREADRGRRGYSNPVMAYKNTRESLVRIRDAPKLPGPPLWVSVVLRQGIQDAPCPAAPNTDETLRCPYSRSS
jgi:hypothetical protein